MVYLNLKGLNSFFPFLQVNRWSPSGAFVAPQVRSLRKGNSDHIAIAVDEDPGSTSRIEEEDDKGNSALNLCTGFWCFQQFLLFNSGFPLFVAVHGFKSLTSSKVVPRFTRPLTDLIDGLWWV